jgi:hypothetical protein
MVYKNRTNPDEAARVLTQEATRRWQEEEDVVDDITCIILFLK